MIAQNDFEALLGIAGFVGLAVLMVLGMNLFQLYRRGQFINALKWLMQKEKGNCIGTFSVFKEIPIVELNSKEHSCRVVTKYPHKFPVGGGHPTMTFQFKWPYRGIQLNLVPESIASRFTRMLRLVEDVEVGDAKFDRAWTIQTNLPDSAPQLLNEVCRAQITRLSEVSRLEQLTISGTGVVFTAATEAKGKNNLYLIYEYLAELRSSLVETATQVDRTAPATAKTAIKSQPKPAAPISVGALAKPDVSNADCLVCGDPIDESNYSKCARCSSPYHVDCWNYVGHCSIFACLSNKSVQRNN